MPFLSYAQRYEDVYLSRCFAGLREGFYIDVGAGHPVHDSASFAFYLQGWRGITVEPNPRLVRLTRAVRPRDCCIEAVIGGASGEATFYLVDELHGFSTTIEAHAQSAQEQFGKPSRSHRVPMLSLSELCRRHAPRTFEFLKIDVEGAEKKVLLSGDWENFRPKVVVIEALAPYTLAPAWREWEPFLNQHGYAYACFDTLNRYYVAQEAQELAKRFADIESAIACTHQLRTMEPAQVDAAHPDHPLATLLARAFMTDLPLLDPDLICRLLTIDTPADLLDRRQNPRRSTRRSREFLGLARHSVHITCSPPADRRCAKSMQPSSSAMIFALQQAEFLQATRGRERRIGLACPPPQPLAIRRHRIVIAASPAAAMVWD